MLMYWDLDYSREIWGVTLLLQDDKTENFVISFNIYLFPLQLQIG